VPRSLPKSSYLPNRHKKSNWPEKAKNKKEPKELKRAKNYKFGLKKAKLATLVLIGHSGMMRTPLQLPFVHHNPSCDECARDTEEKNRMRKDGMVDKRSQRKTERHLSLWIR